MKVQGWEKSMKTKIILDFNGDRLVTAYYVRWFLYLISVIETRASFLNLMIAKNLFFCPHFLDER